jgi:hypothetical protein
MVYALENFFFRTRVLQYHTWYVKVPAHVRERNNSSSTIISTLRRLPVETDNIFFCKELGGAQYLVRKPSSPLTYWSRNEVNRTCGSKVIAV